MENIILEKIILCMENIILLNLKKKCVKQSRVEKLRLREALISMIKITILLDLLKHKENLRYF
jgi:hypothetical protein